MVVLYCTDWEGLVLKAELNVSQPQSVTLHVVTAVQNPKILNYLSASLGKSTNGLF